VAEQQARPDQGLDIGILVTIRSLLPNLAPVERRVAQAVLDDPQGVAWRSISELARTCGTSATSVVRFCRAIGLRGYPDLRLALAGAVARDDATTVTAASHDISPDDDAATITKKIAYADARAVTDTANHLDIATLVQVTEALAKAARIDIYGVGASGYVALDLQMKLQRIGRPAFAWPDPHMAISSAALRGGGDVAIGLSHTGTTVDTIDALREARGHGALTVAVTNFPWSPITEVADYVLLTAARETAFRSGAMTSRIAQLTVVDCLFVTLAQQDLPGTQVALERTFAAAQAKRVRRSRRQSPSGLPPAVGAAPDLGNMSPRHQALAHLGPDGVNKGRADDGGRGSHPLRDAGDVQRRVAEAAAVVQQVVGDLGQLGQPGRRRDGIRVPGRHQAHHSDAVPPGLQRELDHERIPARVRDHPAQVPRTPVHVPGELLVVAGPFLQLPGGLLVGP
jgi:DNA-binding MurR/RpiR family transcriptional regulator